MTISQQNRLNLFRKIYSHIKGIDPNVQTNQQMNFTDVTGSGVIPVAVTNDKKFPLDVVQTGFPTGGIIGDGSNPDDNYTQTLFTNNSSFGANGTLTTNTMTSTTAFTLPANKTIYITNLWASMNTAAGATKFQWQLLDNTNSVILINKDANPPTPATAACAGDQMMFEYPFKYVNPSAVASASIVIQILTDVAANAAKGNAGIVGWYQ